MSENMKKYLKALAILVFLILILPGLIYLGLAIYYQDSFMYGTWINGIYCTGKTIYQVADELEETFVYEELKVITPVGEEALVLEEIDARFDFVRALEAYRRKQNPYSWYLQIIGKQQEQRFLPYVEIDENKLKIWLENTRAFQNNLNLQEDSLEIIWSEKGYALKENKEPILNISLAMERISFALSQAQEVVDLEKEDCFFFRDETREMQKTRDYFSKIDEFQNRELTYKIKEIEKQVLPQELGALLDTGRGGLPRLTEQGDLKLSEQRVKEFVDQLAKDYDSWHNYQFITHDGREIFLKKGNYGTQIHRKKEQDFLMDWIRNPVNTVREPVYLKDFTYRDKNKIDTTYIEIDMTNQKMFYFADGKLTFETDVVTGCVKQNMGTPEMVCQVQRKTRDAILRGANYRSFVNYWVPVYGGIGIHDATWRDEFGGDIYIRSGSHRCINTPLEKMTELYETIEVGTPVVIHY